MYPVEYLEMLYQEGHSVVYEWLRANNAPEEVVDAIQGLCILGEEFLTLPEKETQTRRFIEIESLEDCLSSIIKGIIAMGGILMGGNVSLKRRKPVKWCPVEPVEAPARELPGVPIP